MPSDRRPEIWQREGMPGVSTSRKPLGSPKETKCSVVPGIGERVTPPTARLWKTVPWCLKPTYHRKRFTNVDFPALTRPTT
mmetsp:Transcript_106898/g.201399  ORF Transcript_106898/g.201399 Transcript_106898/m.201399 type:complete len:81 (+) Transcript_106898:38-280(+)